MKAIYILLLFLAIASCVNANTEILRFTTKNIAQLCTEEYEIASEHDVLDTASILTPPFTKLQAKIVPADDVQLYKLQNLTEGSSYELRISYPAITPADFTMRITQLCRLNRNVGSVEGLIKLTAVYTGISSIKDMDKNPVVYNLGMPYLMMFACSSLN
ncbi:hypothetical protein BDF20DRAFT_884587 [Mycotypha africana]|uniref:uncharacterized protein n=1 Tax=Mycotypha africana TaxID=64632 RepID=UPI002300EFF3|nr:uncharacterized protein BDF20DRAFT_884587 [Mycotypha africana]KAI8971452.1 hypothetical protein BDF20DRAFT_884587 [Mycotypha africana]